ncbi:hypothetical protein B0T17DRAFT_567669 [Bombardia bombarda]|uniref:SMODS and SLOG-associating 2TM effector domain-containing protein n=1 Tax=Bombardia bombarda TaxID=252184 RepID=A0AA40CH96_9PEZI|nr:hypothetical protein B0T17DRAFT_567669 [Bombardia bombarda]
MANVAPHESGHLSFPSLKTDLRSDTGESFYKPDRSSSMPVPLSQQSQPRPVTSVPPKGYNPHVHHRFLTPTEWARVAHGVGAIQEGGETHAVVHPTCWYWPPKGLPNGLYRDVVIQRTKYFVSYHVLSSMRWLLMIFQIILGAILTALGSLDLHDGTPITVLAAVNTIDAGLLALMHNSGVPDRYRLDKTEFTKVEDFLKELLDTGIVESGQTVDDILSDCFARFQTAKATVLANMPDSYTTSASNAPEKPPIICPDPPVHFYTLPHPHP